MFGAGYCVKRIIMNGPPLSSVLSIPGKRIDRKDWYNALEIREVNIGFITIISEVFCCRQNKTSGM
jgi:hypothetical protein